MRLAILIDRMSDNIKRVESNVDILGGGGRRNKKRSKTVMRRNFI